MRRKRRYGVYTNKTLKFCSNCIDFCQTCKGKCKLEVIGYENSADAPISHPEVSKKKPLYKFGVGSLERGRKFVFKLYKNHRKSSINEEKPTKVKKKQNTREALKEQLFEYLITKHAS